MAYSKTNWINHKVNKERTYEQINNQDGSVTLQDAPNNVIEFGTPVDAAHLNHIEEGISACSLRKYSEEETYELGEWATGTVDNKKKIYESLTDDNLGNPLNDSSKWKEVDLNSAWGQISGDITEQTDLGPLVASTRFDGQWEQFDDAVAILSGATITGTKEYDISDFLPDDGCKYELAGMLSHISSTQNTLVSVSGSGGGGSFNVRNPAAGVQVSCAGCIVVDLDRKVVAETGVNTANKVYISFGSYRRLGTNE